METLEITDKKQVRTMVRKLGKKTYTGTLTIVNGKYSYYYPYGAELGKKMTSGDLPKIAKLSKVSIMLVSLVLSGKRWNEEVLRNAQIFAKRNVELGFLE